MRRARAGVRRLLCSTLSEGTEYYKHVDEVMANPTAWYGKNLQLHGFVKGEPAQKRNTLEYRFDVQNNGKVVRAYYTGIVPDTFKTDSEVVLKGRLAPDGTFQVEKDGVMAKCPSSTTPRSFHREARVRARRQYHQHVGHEVMASLGSYLLLTAFVICAYAAAISIAGARRRSRRLIESGIGAFYLTAAVMVGRIGGDDLLVRHRRLLDQIRPALFRRGPAALLQDHVVLGRPRRLDHVLGLPAVDLRQRRCLREPGAAPGADSRMSSRSSRWSRCSSCS